MNGAPSRMRPTVPPMMQPASRSTPLRNVSTSSTCSTIKAETAISVTDGRSNHIQSPGTTTMSKTFPSGCTMRDLHTIALTEIRSLVHRLHREDKLCRYLGAVPIAEIISSALRTSPKKTRKFSKATAWVKVAGCDQAPEFATSRPHRAPKRFQVDSDTDPGWPPVSPQTPGPGSSRTSTWFYEV